MANINETVNRWLRSDNPISNSGPAHLNLKRIGLAALVIILTLGVAVAEAQQSSKLPLVARLAVSANASRSEAFQQGLRDLDYLAGKNIAIDDRDAGGEK